MALYAVNSPADPKMMKLRQHFDDRLIGLRTERYSWWLHWREIADYLIPRRYKWLVVPNQMNRGSSINQRIIDSTGTLAWRACTAGMMAGITSPARPWFRLGLHDKGLSEYGPVREWLDTAVSILMRIFAESNFYNVMHTAYGDLVAFGTAPFVIYEDYEDVINCVNACAGEYFLANNAKLRADVFYREFVRNVAQIVEEFGLENCSETVKSAYRSGGAQLRMERVIAHGIEPNADYEEMDVPGMKGFKYRELYWEWGSGSNCLLRMRGFHENPVIAARWDISSNDPYGRSPGMDALGDIKQLQVQQKRKGQAIDKQVNPPLIADASLRNQPTTGIPGGITYVNSTAGTQGMKPIYEVKPELGDMRQDLLEVQKRVQNAFFYDLFLMISQLDTVRTATEINERKQEKLIQLGPVLERFQFEALDPIIDRVFAIAQRKGLFPPAPNELKSQSLEVEYISMLADAQKAAMTSGLERFAGFVGSIAAGQQGRGGQPEVLDNVDWDHMAEIYADAMGVPSKVIIPYAKVLKVRQQRQVQQSAIQAQPAMENATAAVQGAKVLSETDVGGGQSALQRMMGGA